MNFNIIDGSPEDLDYDAILEDYQNLEIPVKEIQNKHGLSTNKWNNIIREFKEQGVPLRGTHRQAPRKHTRPQIRAKNYSFDKRKQEYRVTKHINGKLYCFGNYLTEQEAIDRVQELRNNNWNGLIE